MGLRLRHTSLFLTYVLAPLCAISNFNYEQVNPRNSPATMLLHGRLSFRKPVLPSPSSGLVHRAFPEPRSSNNKPGGLTRHLPALAEVKQPELIDQPCWSATEFVNKSWLPAKLMRFEDVNPVTWAYLG